MKLKKIYSNHFPFKGYRALAIYPWVFIRNDKKKEYTPTVNRHEVTHGLQQIETAWVLFLVIYALEYIVKLFLCGFNHNKTCHSVSFEQEACTNWGKVDYNNNRKHYAWVKYIFKLW